MTVTLNSIFHSLTVTWGLREALRCEWPNGDRFKDFAGQSRFRTSERLPRRTWLMDPNQNHWESTIPMGKNIRCPHVTSAMLSISTAVETRPFCKYFFRREELCDMWIIDEQPNSQWIIPNQQTESQSRMHASWAWIVFSIQPKPWIQG